MRREGAEEMLAESIRTGLKAKLILKPDLERVNVDTTVREKKIRHPADAKLYHRPIETLALFLRDLFFMPFRYTPEPKHGMICRAA